MQILKEIFIGIIQIFRLLVLSKIKLFMYIYRWKQAVLWIFSENINSFIRKKDRK